ncbi:MAG: NfeD family protein [Chitinophagales bacterium]|nr:NfeD family protein [Chitinophagales bacterium]
MDVSSIISIIAAGIILVLVEIFLIPGTTIMGIIGYAMIVVGVVLSYTQFPNSNIGHFTLAGTSIATGILLYLSYKVYTSRRLSLNEVIDGRVNVLEDGLVQTGDIGKAVTFLRPHGKADFGDNRLEVFAQDEYIDAGTEVTVIKIENNKIFVKPTYKIT